LIPLIGIFISNTILSHHVYAEAKQLQSKMHQEKPATKPISIVKALKVDWLRLTKIGLYVCLSNIIALGLLSLIGIVSPYYYAFVEGIGETEIYTHVTIYRAYVAIVLYLMLIPAFFKLHNGIKETISPDWSELSLYSVENNDTISLLNNISKKLDLSPLKMLVVSKHVKPPIFYYATDEQQGTIAISEAILSVLSKDELEAALTHEIYHARSGTSHFFIEKVTEKYEDLFFGILLFFPLAEIIMLLTVILSLTNLSNYFAAAVFSIIVLLPGLIGTFHIGSNFINLLQKYLPTLIQQELYADWFTVLTTRRPLDLARALSLINTPGGDFEPVGLSKTISLKREEAMKLGNFLKPKIFFDGKVKERQAMLIIFDRLINSDVIVDIKRIPESFGWSELISEKSLLLSEFSAKFDQLGEENIRKIFEYMSKHKKFNLNVCTHDLDLDSELVLCGIFALVMGGALEIHLSP